MTAHRCLASPMEVSSSSHLSDNAISSKAPSTSTPKRKRKTTRTRENRPKMTDLRFATLEQDIIDAGVSPTEPVNVLDTKLKAVLNEHPKLGSWLTRSTKTILRKLNFGEEQISALYTLKQRAEANKRTAELRSKRAKDGYRPNEEGRMNSVEDGRQTFENHLALNGFRADMTPEEFHANRTEEREKPYSTGTFSNRLKQHFNRHKVDKDWTNAYWSLQKQSNASKTSREKNKTQMQLQRESDEIARAFREAAKRIQASKSRRMQPSASGNA